MSIKISIVIPVYGTEDFLSECLESCINQTLKEIEIIVVNDCSPNNCREIVQKFQKQDNRIIFIDLPHNMGTLNARMEGYKIARGEYIQSLDSDDTLTKNACEIIYQTFQAYNNDILHISMHTYHHPNKNHPIKTCEMFIPKSLELTQDQWLHILFTRNLDNCMCSYVIKKELIQKLLSLLPQNTHITLYEDLMQIFTLALSIPIDKIISIPNRLYEYRHGVGITTTGINPKRYTKNLTDTIRVTSHVYAAAKQNNLSPELLIELMGYLYQMSYTWSLHISLSDKEKQLQVAQELQNLHLMWDYTNMVGINEYYQLLYRQPVIPTAALDNTLSANEQKVLEIFHCIRKIINKFIPPSSFLRNIIHKIINIIKKLYIHIKKSLRHFSF
ncbi:Glycosyl transferase family 2 [Brevinema andersonii]|uniref:Glycosyl transferase family 2 n=1 Tax=Brevinema andersonii TaxID=34097 RepID=A0A1I1EYT5_BREAD|nr:glycosyltransferase family 2 protein [Brevinema andersonii]SFB91832.1 Glycosyl transferase family 2 [Brevinema andersonii]